MDKILVIDYGSQYNELIVRRVRDFGVYALLIDNKFDLNSFNKDEIKGIILSGGPNSVNDSSSPKINSDIFSFNVPILGICYGMQALANYFGGEVKENAVKEYGNTSITYDESLLFEGVKKENTVFMSHSDTVIKLPNEFKNNSDIKIYMLNIRNSKFDLGNLHTFIRDNIEHYVMSFLEEKTYYAEGTTKHLIDDAINKFLDNTKDQNILDAYSKLMLYIFMECGLGAPKLFNAIEIPEKNIASDGVYYLKGGTISDKPMLVLGTSNTFPSLEAALENILIQAELIANHQDDLITFITPSFLKLRFDQDNLSFIVDKLIKAEGLLENEASFGIFLSYSLNETNDGSMTQQDFINHIKEKMEQDITNAIPLIYEKIKSHNLQNYNFFVFVLPLTEVNSDVSYVIKKFSRGETNV